MDKLIIPAEASGFPETIEFWEFIEKAYRKPIEALAKMIGQDAIVEGVTTYIDNGITYVTNGTVIINGEVMPFIGGALDAKVSVIRTTVTKEFNTDINNQNQLTELPAYEMAVAQIGTIIGAESVTLLSDLKRVKQVAEHLAVLAKGTIYIGDLTLTVAESQALTIEVAFAQAVDFTNYAVISNFRLANGTPLQASDLTFAITEKTVNGYKLILRAVGQDFTGLFYDYRAVSEAQGDSQLSTT